MQSKVMFFYGTLKKGHYNHTRFSEDGIGKFLGEDRVTGYSLVQPDGLPYPFAVPDVNGTIKGELYEVEDKLYNFLHRMELGAGYTPKHVTTTKDSVDAIMYVSERDSFQGLPRFDFFPIS